MTTEVTPQQKFEERIKDKLRQDIGDLLPDDVLAAMVEKGMHAAFFEKRVSVSRDNWGGKRTHEEMPWLVDVVRDLLEDKAKAEIKAFVAANEDHIRKTIDDMIKDGLISEIVKRLDWTIQQSMGNVAQQAVDSIVRNA